MLNSGMLLQFLSSFSIHLTLVLHKTKHEGYDDKIKLLTILAKYAIL